MCQFNEMRLQKKNATCVVIKLAIGFEQIYLFYQFITFINK